MCDFSLSSESKMTPRSRTTVYGDMMSGPTWMTVSTEESLVRFVADQGQRSSDSSVLFVFSWRCFEPHQLLTESDSKHLDSRLWRFTSGFRGYSVSSLLIMSPYLNSLRFWRNGTGRDAIPCNASHILVDKSVFCVSSTIIYLFMTWRSMQ
jgi:hypothetical protein